MEKWSDGVMEKWSNGVMEWGDHSACSSTPILLHSITPILGHVSSSSWVNSALAASSCDQVPRVVKRLSRRIAYCRARPFHGRKSAAVTASITGSPSNKLCPFDSASRKESHQFTWRKS